MRVPTAVQLLPLMLTAPQTAVAQPLQSTLLLRKQMRRAFPLHWQVRGRKTSPQPSVALTLHQPLRRAPPRHAFSPSQEIRPCPKEQVWPRSRRTASRRKTRCPRCCGEGLQEAGFRMQERRHYQSSRCGCLVSLPPAQLQCLKTPTFSRSMQSHCCSPHRQQHVAT